jgi:hypothetical protein
MQRAETVARDWLKGLGVLTAGTMPRREGEDRLAAYAPLLAAEFPREAFVPASLSAIAKQCKFFPNYGEVATLLSAWWKENRPIPRQIAAPIPEPRTPPTEEEKAAVDAAVEELFRSMGMRRPAAPLPAYSPSAPASRPPAVMSDKALLAAYEQAGPAGAVRAAGLRAKLGTPAPGVRV